MILSRLSANLKGPWMIDPMSAETMLPILRSVLAGLSISMEAPEVISERTPVATEAASGGSASQKVIHIYLLHFQRSP